MLATGRSSRVTCRDTLRVLCESRTSPCNFPICLFFRARFERASPPFTLDNSRMTHIHCHEVAACFRTAVTLGGGKQDPFIRLNLEFLRSPCLFVQAQPILSHPKFILRTCVTKLCGSAHPHS